MAPQERRAGGERACDDRRTGLRGVQRGEEARDEMRTGSE